MGRKGCKAGLGTTDICGMKLGAKSPILGAWLLTLCAVGTHCLSGPNAGEWCMVLCLANRDLVEAY